MALISENFNELTVGSTSPPAGWSATGPVIIANASPQYAGLHYLTLAFGSLFTSSFASTASITLFFGWRLADQPGGYEAGNGLARLLALDSGGVRENTIVTLRGEPDNSISVLSGHSFLGNTGPFSGVHGAWYFIQLNITLGTSGGFVTCACDVAVEGAHLLTNAGVTTDIPVATLTAVGIDMVQFSGQGTSISEVTVEALTAINNYPRIATPTGIETQTVIEVSELPTNSSAVVGQMVIEIMQGLPIPPPPPPQITNIAHGTRGGLLLNAWDRCMIEEMFFLWRHEKMGCGRVPDCFHPCNAYREYGDADRIDFSIPNDALRFFYVQSIPLPSPASQNVDVILQQVSIGYDGFILGHFHQYTGPGSTNFAEGSGDIAWRIQISLRYARDLGNMLLTMGSPRTLMPIEGGIQVQSGDSLHYQVNASNLSGFLPSPGTGTITCGLYGYYYPRK